MRIESGRMLNDYIQPKMVGQTKTQMSTLENGSEK